MFQLRKRSPKSTPVKETSGCIVSMQCAGYAGSSQLLQLCEKGSGKQPGCQAALLCVFCIWDPG